MMKIIWSFELFDGHSNSMIRYRYLKMEVEELKKRKYINVFRFHSKQMIRDYYIVLKINSENWIQLLKII